MWERRKAPCPHKVLLQDTYIESQNPEADYSTKEKQFVYQQKAYNNHDF